MKLRCQIADVEVPSLKTVSLNSEDLLKSSDFAKILQKSSNDLVNSLQSEQKELIESLFEKHLVGKEDLIPNTITNPVDQAVTLRMK